MRKFILFTVLFSALYIVLVMFAAFFGMAWSWGHKLTPFEKAVFFFLGGPFNVKEQLFLYVLPNAIFWSILLYFSTLLIRRTRDAFSSFR